MSEVNIKVSASTEGLSAGLEKAKQSVNEFKESSSEKFNEVGGEFAKMFAAGAVVEGLKGVGEEYERLQKLSIRFGESAESMQRVGAAAKQNGTDLEQVAKAMQKVTVNAVEAIKGNQQYSDAFDALGINAKEFVDLPLEEKLSRLAEAYDSGASNAQKMDAVQHLLSKGGAELIPMFAQGADALRDQFQSASVASNEAVQSIADANERLQASFTMLKSWAAEALGWITQRVRALGEGLAITVAYVSNLSHGFAAAKQAAEEAAQAAADLHVEEDEHQQKQMERAKKGGTADNIEATKEQAKAEDDLQKLRDENNQKLWEAHERAIDIYKREYEIREEMVKLEGDIANAKAKGDEAGQLRAENRKLDLQKELEENTAKQKKEAEKSANEIEKLQTKAAKEKTKAVTQAKKEELEAAEKNFTDLEKKSRSSFSVDSLRAVGGGIANVNYRGIGAKEDMQRQALRLAKEQVEQLKSVVKALEDKNKFLDFAGNGAYAAE